MEKVADSHEISESPKEYETCMTLSFYSNLFFSQLIIDIMASTRNSTDTLNSDSTEKKGNSTAGSVTIEMGVERQDSKTSDVDRETDL